MTEYLINVKLNEQQLADAQKFIKSLNLKNRIFATVEDGSIKDITDDPKYKGLVERVRKKLGYD